MATEPVDREMAIRTARRGRWLFLAVAAVAAASGPIAAGLTGALDVFVLLGGLATAGAALFVGLPIFHREIRRLRQARSGAMEHADHGNPGEP